MAHSTLQQRCGLSDSNPVAVDAFDEALFWYGLDYGTMTAARRLELTWVEERSADQNTAVRREHVMRKLR